MNKTSTLQIYSAGYRRSQVKPIFIWSSPCEPVRAPGAFLRTSQRGMKQGPPAHQCTVNQSPQYYVKEWDGRKERSLLQRAIKWGWERSHEKEVTRPCSISGDRRKLQAESSMWKTAESMSSAEGGTIHFSQPRILCVLRVKTQSSTLSLQCV